MTLTFHPISTRRVLSALAAAAILIVAFSVLAASPASASHANEKTTFFENADEGWGYTDVEPGTGVNLDTRYTCWWWGCPNFDDKVSSVTTRGSAALLFADKDFLGAIVCVQPHSMRNLSDASFDNKASSVFVRSGSWSGARNCPSTYNGRDVKILG